MKGALAFTVVCGCVAVVGAVGFTKAVQYKVAQQLAVISTETVDSSMYLYVFDREKEVWYRATNADLKSAPCEDLQAFSARMMMEIEEER